MTDFLCDALSLFCADHGEHVSRATPEIAPAALLSAFVLIVGGMLIAQRRRGR